MSLNDLDRAGAFAKGAKNFLNREQVDSSNVDLNTC